MHVPGTFGVVIASLKQCRLLIQILPAPQQALTLALGSHGTSPESSVPVSPIWPIYLKHVAAAADDDRAWRAKTMSSLDRAVGNILGACRIDLGY